MVSTHSHDAGSHSRTVLSLPPETSRPSGRKARARTSLVCPWRKRMGAPGVSPAQRLLPRLLQLLQRRPHGPLAVAVGDAQARLLDRLADPDEGDVAEDRLE